MSDVAVTQTLLVESHRLIERNAEHTVEQLGVARRKPLTRPEHDSESLTTYPPGEVLSVEEDGAIRSMRLSALQKSALKKLIADACAAVMFDFFNLVDGTTDPEVSPINDFWVGASIVEQQDDRHTWMLHDQFLDTYHDYMSLCNEDQDD